MYVLQILIVFLITGIQIVPLHCFNLDVNHVIIYEDPLGSPGKRSSYFGFSLLLYSEPNGTKSWIQIGAPRGNDPKLYKGVKEPGVIYRCPILDTCKTVALDKISSGTKIQQTINGTTYSYTDDKNGAWIGGAMDIDEMNGQIAVCGHRWRFLSKSDKIDYMLGICYLSSVEQSIGNPSGIFRLLPLNEPENYFHSSGNNKYYLFNYGMGQAGHSVHFPRNTEKSELLMGAPGLSNWKGSVAHYKASDNNKYKNYSSVEVLDPKSLYVEQYTLFGYQVNSGKFDNTSKLYYVSGNPKGTNKGRVYLYTHKSDSNINVVKWLDGTQTGEYFGSSLAIADVNCDGIDDLIVGAPQHTINHDEGRIYVFISNSQTTVFSNPTIITGKVIGGRFGTSVASLGDLDKDGCDDIAVGAPYANNNTGVVYIYNGGFRGVILSQTLIGHQIHPHLKGFGISISHGTDVDHNGYPDVAVGAFLSDQAVLFRAQPVISLSTSITSVSELQKGATSFIINVCLSYTGLSEHTPNRIEVMRYIIADEKLGRTNFLGKRNILNSTVIIKNKRACEDIEVFLMKTALEENESDPVTVKVTQELINSGGSKSTVMIGSDSNIRSKDGFNKNFPVVNQRRSSLSAILNIPFAVECGNYSECEAELELNSSFSGITNGAYMIGSQSKLKLEVHVINKKQPAYRTEVNITIPFPIELSSGDKTCKESASDNGLMLLCKFGNPLRNGTMRSLILNLDTNEVRPGLKSLIFFISVSTSSKDKNKSHNSQKLQLNLIVDANLNIMRRVDELVYNYAKANRTVFRHRYEVQKTGSSPIEVIEMELNIPIGLLKFNKTKFLDLYRPMAYLNGEQEITCLTERNFEYLVEETMESLDINLKNNESVNINDRTKREAIEKELDLQTNEILFLNCTTPNVQCVKIRCNAGPFDSAVQDSASIELKMIMNTNELSQQLGEKNTISLSTQLSVSIKEPVIDTNSQSMHMAEITTIFVNSTSTEEAAQGVPTWIIALSIIAGFLALMFVVIGFIKAGFFERKKERRIKVTDGCLCNKCVYSRNDFKNTRRKR